VWASDFFLHLPLPPGYWLHTVTDESSRHTQARFTGIETTSLVSATEACTDSDDNSGKYFTYTFTDRNGTIQHITRSADISDCQTNMTLDGQDVTLWYQPGDPAHFIMADDLYFDLIFLAAFSLPLLICLVLCLIALVRGLLVASQNKLPSSRTKPDISQTPLPV
jgi:hypothetical protein